MKDTKPRMLSAFSEHQIEHPLAHELPYWDFEDGIAVLADGSLALGLELEGIAIETLEASRMNQLAVDLRSFLNSIPDEAELTFHQELGADYGDLIGAHQALSGNEPIISWVSESRVRSLQTDAGHEILLRPKLYLTVYKRRTRSDKSTLPFWSSFFKAPDTFVSVTRAEHDKSAKELHQLTENSSSSLASFGIRSRKLTTAEYRELIYRFLNPTRSRTIGPPQLSTNHRAQEFMPGEIGIAPQLALPSPRQQIIFSDVIQGYDSFYFDGHYHRIISLKGLPEFTHSAMISRLGHLPFTFTLQVHVKVPTQSKELASLQARRRMAHSMSLSQGGRATDLESEARLQSTEDTLREIINTGQKIFYFQLEILLSARSQEELDQKTQATLSKLREMNGCEGMAETVASFKTFKTMLPFGNTTMVRAQRIKTDNLADLLPLYEPYDGKTHEAAKPVCLFRNRSMGLLQYDPFDPNLPNYNTLVTGSSGAGKSFLNNLVLLQYATQNPQIFIIDIGGSYRKLCELLGGQYIEIAPSRVNELVQSINPLELPPGAKEPSPQKTKFLLSLLENLLTDEDGDRLPKLQKSLLEELLLKTYQQTDGCPSLSDLSGALSNAENSSLREFAKTLYPWTGDRPYGRLLDAPTSLDLKDNLVVFDLKGLSTYPDLQSAMLLIITDFILGRIDTSNGRRSQIIMDECWELLKSNGSQRFMEYCVRTLRKTGSGITFITQGLEEIVRSPIGPAILTNTASKFVLLQRGDLSPTREFLKLNEQEMALISTLRQSKGHYSEAFLMANEDRTVVQIHPTPIEYWIATSDASDNEALNKRRSENPKLTLAEHIYQISQLYPFGVKEKQHDES